MVGFGVSEAQARSSVCLFLLSADRDVELSASSLAPRLPAMFPHDNNSIQSKPLKGRQPR